MSLKKKAATAVAVTLSAAMALAGCGGGGNESEGPDDNSEMVVEMFSQDATAQGMQTGWFAKIIKDKFNIKLKVIAPGVTGNAETLFETRSAAGNLGDVILTHPGNGRLQKLVKSNLLADLTPYAKNAKHFKQYQGALDRVSKVAGKKGIWGIPSNVSMRSPTESNAGDEPGNSPHIRWDYYREVGYPEIKNLDDFLNVLKLMQDKARADTGQKDIYALSMFKDWDGPMMKFPMDMAAWYGYNTMNTVLTKADGSDDQTPIQEGGIYEKMLRFLNKAERMGLIDPDSSTQTWDNITAKTSQGKMLLDIWSWLGQPRINSTANKAKGIGFMLAPLQDMDVYSDGFAPNGADTILAIGAKAKNKQRLVNFLDWLYSPEGVYATAQNAGGPVCPEKMCWTKTPEGNKMTDFGLKAMNEADGLKVPAEFGGGDYNKGISMMHFQGVNQNDIDPNTKETYNSALWKTELAKPNALRDDWGAHMAGAKTALEYLEKKHQVLVAPGAGYIAPEEDSQITAVRGQVKTELVSQSWKAVYAKDDNEFNAILKTMRTNVQGLGYEQLEKIDMANAKAQTKARQDIVKEYADRTK
ncbi:ABC transporter substrate-binding protein [Bifidobacterium favimelis]|uniref:Extracellular solute-binding protein n=1 Tax=Bifidobacterium favimelis TaxID=3122979 RepID=A0ABU8ZQ86_9BIFI